MLADATSQRSPNGSAVGPRAGARGTITADDGTTIAFRVDGSGPPLLLIMGYRLSSHAWPDGFVGALAARFTVIRFDNRGTGESGKPVFGYALDNLARDACALLDRLGVSRTHVLGYSMGGAIAQEFVRLHPARVLRLVLCATLCGGPLAIYAGANVQRALHCLQGLTPTQAAQQIWSVTYADGYLATHRAEAQAQMERETAWPTPLHAADLQFQALTHFDCSAALPTFRCPTLVLTGDEDRLVPPANTAILATLIPHAQSHVLSGRGHRVLWEATDECVALIGCFLASDEKPRCHSRSDGQDPIAATLALAGAWSQVWSGIAARATAQALGTFRAMGPELRVPFGDGKPVIVVAGTLLPLPMAAGLATWLETIGYRAQALGSEADVAAALSAATTDASRKAVLLASESDVSAADGRYLLGLHALVSDVVLLTSWGSGTRSAISNAVPAHRVPLTPALPLDLARILHKVPIVLLENETSQSASNERQSRGAARED